MINRVFQSALLASSVVSTTLAFVPPMAHQQQLQAVSTSSLFAVGGLVKKAKQAELRKYIEDGVEDHVMEKYKEMKANMEKDKDNDSDSKQQLQQFTPGPLQTSLTKRKGTITVIAEFKRKNSETERGVINDIFIPDLVSATFRDFGASAIAVMADDRMGGCNYADLATFVEEQRRAKNNVPGPIPVINNDLIIDELQVARSAAYGCVACVINLAIVGIDQAKVLVRATRAAGLEAIVAVSTKEDAQTAIDMGARLLSIIHLNGVDEKVAAIDGLTIPDGQQVCMIANILARKNKELQEVEEAWAVRDKGFNCIWVGEALFKAGADMIETPGAIIKSMKSKSSLKFASPKAYSGRGEGAREYLGDIMM